MQLAFIIQNQQAFQSIQEMRREGRQHGLVQTYIILPELSDLKPRTTISDPPTAGIFTRVPSKPTNHSKFTGRCSKVMCSCCHDRPTCKAKAKAKGNHKIKSAHFAMHCEDELSLVSEVRAYRSIVHQSVDDEVNNFDECEDEHS